MQLPILNLNEFETNKEEFLEKLRNATSQVGFFYLVGHGINLDLCKKLQSLSKEFFALPQKEKDKISMIHSPQFRGYSGEGGEYTDGGKDYREQIDIGTEREALEWNQESPLWQRLEGPNLWPEELPELKNVFLQWHYQTQKACLKLLRAFAEALELPQDAFEQLYGRNSYEHCKLLRYKAASHGERQGVGSHKDGGLITFVLQDQQSGLQALVDGEWIDVLPLEGSVVVNIGEFLEMATNGYLKATIHRVNLGQVERYSTAYFLGIQLDKDVPIFKLNPKFADKALGVDTDPKNPLLRNVAENYFKRMIRSHPDVAKAHHGDLIKHFSFA
ncbi:2-oxobutyrate oxidase [Helicobacter monodelphidis]|uniref:isopenicillin N synthase family dioxygenase n=1 Tax=Helicobacter sp. 15-1451 TaxID=2004995 RepID=UPI000DCC2745|nr:isopenicillin N synthase family oxygenase [Helicobacter sp. 15-1451]RAX56609.1 2-oxobutyrate oxidase [Helicobacter sp. 15-1451]